MGASKVKAEGKRPITSTWTMKKKSDWTYLARLVARGFQQVDGQHYNDTAISLPVRSDTTMCMVLTIKQVARYDARVIDVKGAFLMGDFEINKEIYINVPEGFKKYFPKETHGYKLWSPSMDSSKQAHTQLKGQKSYAGKWVWTKRCRPLSILCMETWRYCNLDNMDRRQFSHCTNFNFGQRKKHDQMSFQMQWELSEYIGCKVEQSQKSNKLQITQPVLVQSLKDKFELPTGTPTQTPAKPGTTMTKHKEEEVLNKAMHTKYRAGISKLQYLVQISRPDIGNAVWELSRQLVHPTNTHYNAMLSSWGLVLDPSRQWNGAKKEFEWTIEGHADSNYATNPDDQKSVSGTQVFLNGSSVMVKSSTQKVVTLSVTEAKLCAATSCTQDMLFVWRLMTAMELKVKLPMILQCDNKGTINLSKN